MTKRKRKLKKSFKLLMVLLVLGVVAIGLVFTYTKKFNNNDKDKANNENVPAPVKELKIVNLDSKTRPIAVMINNHDKARPYHSGLQEAYIVYEIIVEGGYTRYMALYKDVNLDAIGSVRSSRHYFLDYALENDAIYVHWGWSNKAQEDISTLGVNNINGLNYENVYFYRDKSLNVSMEHTGYTKTEMINKAISKLGYRNTSSKDLLLNYSVDEINLKDMEGSKVANKVNIPYSGITTTSYEYDSNAKVYKRFVNGKEHVDYVTKKQYTAKNIIVYNVSNHVLNGDVKGRQDIDNLGSGNGYFISEGYAVPITWEKKSRTSQTVYKYLNGEEIKVNDGNTFIQIQPSTKITTIA